MIIVNSYKDIVSLMKEMISEINLSSRFVVSIDGPCGGGKTTLAEYIKSECGYNIVHMDDFYLPFQKRNDNWMNTIAGHMDFDRLINEVLKPYVDDTETNYVSYDCHSDKYLKKIDIDLERPLILEGSYSSHPSLEAFVKIKIYVDIDDKTQIERLTKRNKEVVDKFISMWIPFENRYFSSLNIKEKSDIVFDDIDYYGETLILASKSARRKDILAKEGYKFQVFVPKKDESSIVGKKYSSEVVRNCAIDKVENAYQEMKEHYLRDSGNEQLERFNPLIISCDTVVVVDDVIVGKPKDRNEAISILKNLSAKTHQVVSAVAVIKNGKRVNGYEVTKVTFRRLTEEEITEYIDRCKPYDKAGSYGIQDEGFSFVESIEGNIDNVIGLPMKTLERLLMN